MNIFSPGYAKQDGNGCWFLFVLISLSLSLSLNPLTPELNPSEQACLPGFFMGDFKF
jgi:hypothetical protein